MTDSISNQSNISTPGNLIVGGNVFMDGAAFVPSLSPTIPTPTGAAQTIATNTGMVSRTAPSGACTNAVLQAGTINGQRVVITNESTVAANTVTFNTAVATGLVLTNATPTAVVINAAEAKEFIWLASLNGGNGAWVAIGSVAS
jgi:hypothetical protein